MSKNSFNNSFLEVINNPLFPILDNQLRSGRHICHDDLELYEFLKDKYDELELFYRAYSVELICDPEYYYYLRTKSTSIIPSSTLSELEMLCGKVIAILYMNPERLVKESFFTLQDVYDELVSLVEVERLVKIINPRSTGSDLDKAKLLEKMQSALNRLARMGIIAYPNDNNERKRFKVRQTCLRFGVDARSGDERDLVLENLVARGDIVTPESLKVEEQARAALEQAKAAQQANNPKSATTAKTAEPSTAEQNDHSATTSQSKTSPASKSPTGSNGTKPSDAADADDSELVDLEAADDKVSDYDDHVADYDDSDLDDLDEDFDDDDFDDEDDFDDAEDEDFDDDDDCDDDADLDAADDQDDADFDEDNLDEVAANEADDDNGEFGGDEGELISDDEINYEAPAEKPIRFVTEIDHRYASLGPAAVDPHHRFSQEEAQALRQKLYAIKGPSKHLLDANDDGNSVTQAWQNFVDNGADSDVVTTKTIRLDQDSKGNRSNQSNNGRTTSTNHDSASNNNTASPDNKTNHDNKGKPNPSADKFAIKPPTLKLKPQGSTKQNQDDDAFDDDLLDLSDDD